MKQEIITVLIVIDGVGISTLEYLLKQADKAISLPNLQGLGLGNLLRKEYHNLVPPSPEAPLSLSVHQASAYPDSTIGHREMMGVINPETFQLFPDGFPPDFVSTVEEEIGRGLIFNRMAGGMEAIERNHEEHQKTGAPILYASKCDPVLQLAMNEETIPIGEQYRIVDRSFAIARRMGIRITRAIGRPYLIKDGTIYRTPNRHDCTLPLEQTTLVDILRGRGIRTVSVGKTADLVGAYFHDNIKLTDPKFLDPSFSFNFADRKKRDTNPYSIQGLINAIHAAKSIYRPKGTFIFGNLVDTDSLFGHTRDVQGALSSLQEFDRNLPVIRGLLNEGDLIIITADHGMEHRSDYGYHSLEPLPVCAERVGYYAGFTLFSRETLAQVGHLISQIYGCEDDYVRSCHLEEYL